MNWGLSWLNAGGVQEPQRPLVHAIVVRDPFGHVLETRIVDQPRP
jgi:hypothetical protein